tara:strand:- start:14963 stop:17215 length:2253 start_codon:yes stop_codon:yes gene_type:complete
MAGPLEGIKVLNCGTAGVGPWAATLLGYLGAEVVKIERPGGELTRVAYPRRGGVSSAFLALNINQNAMGLDLKNESDREHFETLVKSADVLIENYRPGVAERIGMGFEYLSTLNPRLVMASSPGWGDTGPMRDLGAVDPHLQAFSGFAGLNGYENDDPEMLRYTHIDPNGSVHLAALILLGLQERGITGKGTHVRSSHLAMALFMQSTRIAETLATGLPVKRMGTACATSAPNQCFQAADGAWIAVSVESEAQWQRFCTAIQRDDLFDDPRFRTNADRVENRQALTDRLKDWFIKYPERWWLSRFEAADIAHSRLLELDDLQYHQQIAANGYLVEVQTSEGPLTLGGVPWQFSRTPAAIIAAPSAKPGASANFSGAGSASPEPRAATFVAPLHGVQVVDATEGYAGPLVALLLAEAGATVTRLESAQGDWTRALEPRNTRGHSAAYAAMNRNKSIMRVDAANAEAVARRIAEADVLLSDESSVLSSIELDIDALAAANSALVHLKLSAYGERGPMAKRPASELAIQAMTGYLTDLGDPEDAPVRVGADITGTCSAALAFLGLMAALNERQRSGQGQTINSSLLGSMMCMRTLRWANHSRPDEWKGGDCNSKTDKPWRGYKTADGVIWPTLRTVRKDEDVINIYKALGLYEQVKDNSVFMEEGRDSVGLGYQAQAVKPLWDECLGQLPSDEVLRVFNEHRGIAVEFSELHKLVDHPQIAAIEILDGECEERCVRAPWLTAWDRPAVQQTRD